MLRLAIAAIVLLAPASAQDLYHRAQQKLDKFSANQYKPRQVVDFSPAEINAWAAVKVPESVPEGIRNPHVDLGQGTITATASVDFLKIRQAKGQVTNRLIARMIEGEHPLKVVVRLSSAGGRCTAYLTRVELSGVVLEGSILDFLIQNFFTPLYPDAKINQPFDLDYNIDRIEATPQSLRVTMK
jgi:hypothetical protein